MTKLLLSLLLLTATLTAQFRVPAGYHAGDGALEIKPLIQNDTLLSYHYRIATPERQASATDGYDALTIGALDHLAYPGEPALPYVPLRLIVPAGRVIASVTMVPTDRAQSQSDRPLSYGLAPVIPGYEEQQLSSAADPTIYNCNRPYPASACELVTVQKQAGVAIANINLFPVTYRPASGIVTSYTGFRVEVVLEAEKLQRNTVQAPVYPERVNTAAEGIENPEALPRSSRSRNSGIDYLIITNKAMRSAIVPHTIDGLLARRRAQGLTAAVVTVDSIYSVAEGVDRQQQIRYFLRDAYAKWGMKYVLIAGDTNVVPVRTLSPDVTSGDVPLNTYVDSISAFVPSDFYYQCLDGPYNKPNWFDKEGKYWGRKDGGNYQSMVDIRPEFAIGRIPAENGMELSNWLTKQYAYEAIPHGDPSLGKVFVAGEHLGFGDPGGIMEFAKNCLNEIRFGSDTAGGYSSAGFNALTGIAVDTLFDEDRGLDNRWGFEQMRDAINGGNYSMIQHLGHGQEYEYMHINLNNWQQLTNDQPLFTYSQACLPGRFTNDCIAEELITGSAKHGLWGGIFNTGFGRGSSLKTDGISQRINRNFWDGYFRGENPIRRIGDLNSHSHAAVFDKVKFPGYLYGIYAISVLGDPYAEIKIARAAQEQQLYFTAPSQMSYLPLNRPTALSWFTTSTKALSLSLLDAADGTTQLGTVEAGATQFSWQPAADAATDGAYRFIITDGTMADTSGAFLLADLPEPSFLAPTGESVTKGEALDIAWDVAGPVSLWLCRNGGAEMEISADEREGALTWPIPDSLQSGDAFTVQLFSRILNGESLQSEPFVINPGVVNQFPHIEEFDDLDKGGMLRGYWEQGRGDDAQWRIHSGPTPTKASTNAKAIKTGPSADMTTNSEAGKYIYVEASGDNHPNKRFDLLSPRFDLRGCTGAALSFGLHMYSDSAGKMGTFNLAVVRHGKGDTTIFSKEGRYDTDEWQAVALELNAFDGELIQLRFSGLTDSSYSSDIALDDIALTVETQGKVATAKELKQLAPRDGFVQVAPSIISPADPIARIVIPQGDAQYHWMLFDAVGNLVVEAEGATQGGVVDLLSLFDSPQIGAKSYLLILKATFPDGSRRLSRTMVGVKR